MKVSFNSDIILGYLNERTGYVDRAFWTSGSDAEKEGWWKWMATGKKVTYTNWKPGEPNNLRGNQHFLHLDPQARVWWDRPSSDNASFICES